VKEIQKVTKSGHDSNGLKHKDTEEAGKTKKLSAVEPASEDVGENKNSEGTKMSGCDVRTPVADNKTSVNRNKAK